MQTTVSEPDGGVQILDRHEKCRLGGHAKIISGCINCLQTKLKYRVTKASDVAHMHWGVKCHLQNQAQVANHINPKTGGYYVRPKMYKKEKHENTRHQVHECVQVRILNWNNKRRNGHDQPER